jgi:hypothetical protein
VSTEPLKGTREKEACNRNEAHARERKRHATGMRPTRLASAIENISGLRFRVSVFGYKIRAVTFSFGHGESQRHWRA